MQQNGSEKKIVGMRGFRDLIDDLNQSKDEISNPGMFGDIQISPDKNADKKGSIKFLQTIRKITTGTNIIAFIVQLFQYIFSRLRIVIVLLSVVAELIGDTVEAFKKKIVRHMFWTRGGAFKYAVQIVAVLVLALVIISGNYRSDVQGEEEASSVSEGAEGVVVAGESKKYSDLLVQNATTNTLIPEDRRRIDVVEYTVKNGDTMGGIADFYGISTQTLEWANNLTEANVIRPGDILRIPPGNGVIKKVEEGDDLDKFAARWSGNSQSIADANWIDPPFALTVGQELFVPDGKVPAPVVPTYYSAVVSGGSGWWSSGYVDPNVGQFLVSWPVSGCRGVVTQWPSAWHNAIDIADGGMPDILAAGPGVVRFAGCHSGDCPPAGQQYGGSGAAWGIEIDHGNGYTSFYAHLNALYVTTGQTVYAGQPIAQMGSSGSATGIHLHFELWQGQKWNRATPTSYFTPGVCGKI